jgi:hypothetical protein
MRNYNPITQLLPITSINAEDVLPIVDAPDLTQSPVGSTKKITMGQIQAFVINSNPWQIVPTSPITLQPNHGYIADAPVSVIFNLPVTAEVGDQYFIEGLGVNLFEIHQNTGQSIVFDSFSTTVGPSGYIQSTNVGDGLTILCIQNNTLFKVRSSIGTLLTF